VDNHANVFVMANLYSLVSYLGVLARSALRVERREGGVVLSNIKLNRKAFVSCSTNEEKSFMKLTVGSKNLYYKTFYGCNLRIFVIS